MIPEPFPANEAPGRYCNFVHLASIKHPKPHQQTFQCCSVGPEFKPTHRNEYWDPVICGNKSANLTVPYFTQNQTIFRPNRHSDPLLYIKVLSPACGATSRLTSGQACRSANKNGCKLGRPTVLIRPLKDPCTLDGTVGVGTDTLPLEANKAKSRSNCCTLIP